MMEKTVTILSIDDEEQICFALDELFRFQGWRAVSAQSVEEGLALFRKEQPDIVLIDYHMPHINGVDGVRMLRNLNDCVPIIVFTIDESQAVADAFLEAGASDFALKPIKAPDIVSRIRLHLRLLDRRDKSNDEKLSKGLRQETLALIKEYMFAHDAYLSANDIAEELGLAYQTVYRYLIHLEKTGEVEMLSVYGKVGRPKQLYRRR